MGYVLISILIPKMYCFKTIPMVCLYSKEQLKYILVIIRAFVVCVREESAN